MNNKLSRGFHLPSNKLAIDPLSPALSDLAPFFTENRFAAQYPVQIRQDRAP